MLGIASGYPLTINGFVAGYEDHGFAAIMVSDSQDGVVTFRLREVSD
jgi:hypothetical protein